MPNKNYIKGRNHENYIKRKYEAQGYACVRSSGSKGAVDVIAIKKGPYCTMVDKPCPVIKAIQCKPKNHRPGKSERKKMKEWTERTGVSVIIE